MIQPQMSLNKLLAVIYADLFDFPLTKKEANFWRIDLGSNSRRIPQTVETKGYAVLKGREILVKQRLRRQKYSATKEQRAKEVAEILKIIPSIQGIFLTGSVAVGNAKKEADIDLMIVCSLNTLWLTRLLAVIILKVKRLYREKRAIGDRICTNIYLDTNHMQIKEQNLFTAHEVLQAKCLYDRDGVERRWLEENNWTRDYLPIAYSGQKSKIRGQKNQPKVQSIFFAFCLLPFELISFAGQYLYMKPKMTNEKVGPGYAYFHPNNLSQQILARFNNRLAGLGII